MLSHHLSLEALKLNTGGYFRLGTNSSANDKFFDGQLDEIRIWNESLSQEIIDFHNQYKHKVSSSYDDNYLESLIGLWCFRLNTEGETASNIFRDENDNENYSILYTYGSLSNELSTNGR